MNSDAYEIDGGRVVPFFQPVVSLQTRRIIGYESLGRMERGGAFESLANFFRSPLASAEEQRRVDRKLREMAFDRFASHTSPDMLFVNVRPSWMYRYWKKHHSLRTIEMIEDHRMDASRIVLEIGGDFPPREENELAGIVEQYRTSGCRIAIDNVGGSFAHLDWIAAFHPDYVKVDLRSFAESIARSESEALLRGFALLADQVGASLIVQGVETEEELRFSLRVGAGLVQGFYFSEARAELLAPETFARQLDKVIAEQREQAMAAYQGLYASIERMRGSLPEAPDSATAESCDSFLSRAVSAAPDSCIRAYVCDRFGTQLSANWSRSSGGAWGRDPAYLGSNWSWRPYSLSNTVMMIFERKGALSVTYKDLEGGLRVQTYSLPIGDDCFLFLDFVDPTA